MMLPIPKTARLIWLVVILCGCQPTQPTTPPAAVVAPPAPPAATTAPPPRPTSPTPWAGTFERAPERDGTLSVGPVDETGFTFRLEVFGPNAHIGEVEGRASLESADLARFRGENQCELVFERQDDIVEIRINDWSYCTHYHGARCHLDGHYKRVGVGR